MKSMDFFSFSGSRKSVFWFDLTLTPSPFLILTAAGVAVWFDRYEMPVRAEADLVKVGCED